MNIKKYKESRQYINKGEEMVLLEIEKFCKKKHLSRSWLTHCLYKNFLGLELEEDEIIIK